MEYPHQRNSLSPISSEEKAIGLPRPSISGSILTAEEAELARLGYKQEFKREFSWISTFSFAFSISGLLATVQHSYSFRLNGYRSLLHLDFPWLLEDLLLLYGVGMDQC